MSSFGTMDRWLALRFLRAYLTFAGCAALVFVVIDLFSQLDSLERLGLWQGIKQRYGTMLPELFLMLSPFLVVVAALWVVATLRRQNELIPLLAAGISPRRIALPLVVAGGSLGLLVLADRELVLPALHDLRRARTILRQGLEHPRPIPDERDGAVAVLSPRFYLPQTQEVRDVRYVRLGPDGREAFSAFAATARPATADDGHDEAGWILERGYTVTAPATLDGRDAIAMIPTGGVFVPSTLLVADIEGAVDAPSYQSSKELRRQLRRTPGFKHLEVQLYERWVYPLAGLVLLLLAMPIALGGDGLVDAFLRFLACGALAFAYFFASNVCYELGAREVLPPLVAAFAPLLGFGLAGVVLTLRQGGRRR